jgi:hypothetical protein
MSIRMGTFSFPIGKEYSAEKSREYGNGGQQGALFCALPGEKNQDHPREPLTNHFEHPQTEMKKGAGASPLFPRTDPPNTETQSRLGFGHPGKPIFFKQPWAYGEQTACQHVTRNSQSSIAMKPRELVKF